MCMGRIPIFNTQLEKAREATDAANIRAAYAEAVAEALTSDDHTAEIDTSNAMQCGDWNKTEAGTKIGSVDIKDISKTKGTVETVKIAANGTVTIAPKA